MTFEIELTVLRVAVVTVPFSCFLHTLCKYDNGSFSFIFRFGIIV